MRLVRISLLVVITAFATGCPKYSPKVDFKNPNSLVAKINEYIGAKRTEYDNAIRVNDFASAKRIRNELIENALPYIDGAYVDFITDIQAGRDRTNFLLDLVELGTAAAVGITNGERPLQVIGVGLTAFRGGRRSMDANFYKDQSTPILISKMDGNRAKVRATILTRERSSTDDYSLGAAISDLVDYYNAGTLVRAFAQLQQDTAVSTQAAENRVLELKNVPITTEATVEFRDLSVAAANVVASLDTAFAGSDDVAKEAATKKLQKIFAALEKDKDAAEVVKNANVSSTGTGPELIDALIEIRAAAAMVNNRALLNTINQAIVENK